MIVRHFRGCGPGLLLLGRSLRSLVVKQLFLRGVERLIALASGGDAAAGGLLSRLYATGQGQGLGWDWDEAVRLARLPPILEHDHCPRLEQPAERTAQAGPGRSTEPTRWMAAKWGS